MEFQIAPLEGAIIETGEGIQPCIPLQTEEAPDPMDSRWIKMDLPTTDLRLGEPCVAFLTRHSHDGTMLFTYSAIEVISLKAQEWITEHPEYKLAFIGVRDGASQSNRLRTEETVMAILQKPYA